MEPSRDWTSVTVQQQMTMVLTFMTGYSQIHQAINSGRLSSRNLMLSGNIDSESVRAGAKVMNELHLLPT